MRNRIGLVDRQIITVLPKLSAGQVERFLEELREADTQIARTILNAAIDAADPLLIVSASGAPASTLACPPSRRPIS